MELPSIEAPKSSSERVGLFLLVAAAFIFVHPYTGVRHDGTLYVGDALARLMPGEFRDDLYFFYGSQGRFTLLPFLYAALISTFGLGPGTMAGLLVAFSLYLAASWYLVTGLIEPRLRVFCVLAVALGWGLYGGNRVFGYSEPFLTARSFGEPAVLLGLGLLIRNRLLLAGLALVLALLIHPLIGIAGWCVGWVFLLQRDRRWAWLGLLAVVALLFLGFIGREPFGDVFARYDAEWLALVHEANPHAFVLLWSSRDYGVVAYDATVLYFVCRLSTEGRLRALAIAAIVAGIGATVVSTVLVDFVGNPFFGKLQVWRVEWVMQWTAMAMLPFATKDLWTRPGEQGKLIACFLLIGWIAPFTVAPGLLAVMALLVEATNGKSVVTRATTRVVIAATVISAFAVAVQFESHVVKFGVLLDQPIHQIIGQALTHNVLIVTIASGLVILVARQRRASLIVGLLSLVVALSFWDQRSAWPRKLESYPAGVHIWQGLIEPEARIYWYRDLIAPWILLGHSNYYTQQQGSGAVFSRDMVVELDRRRKVTALLDFQEQICRMMNNLSEKQGSCEPDAEAVSNVCTEGNIDYVILQSSLEGTTALAEYTTGVVENGYEKKFFLYRCSGLKKG